MGCLQNLFVMVVDMTISMRDSWEPEGFELIGGYWLNLIAVPLTAFIFVTISSGMPGG